jgi:hypothetical protein
LVWIKGGFKGAHTSWAGKDFVAIFCISLGIVRRFMPAALEGAVGKLKEIGCRVWAAHSYLHAPTALGLKPMAQAACNDFNKKMYRHGPGVSTGFAVYITLGY